MIIDFRRWWEKEEVWFMVGRVLGILIVASLAFLAFRTLEDENSKIISTIQEQTAQQVEIQKSIDQVQESIEQLFYDTGENMGSFGISYYCPCEKCCGPTAITTSGAKLKPGMCAVDTSVIPMGSKLLINGKVYTATDTGPDIKGKRIDVCVATHQQAIDLGRKTYQVWILKGVN